MPPNALSPLTAPLPESYAQVYASSLRSSRVAAPAKRYGGLTRAELGGTRPPIGGVMPWPPEPLVPHFVLVPPNAAHLAVDWGTHFDMRDANGAFSVLRGKYPRFDIAVSDEHVFIYGSTMSWNGEDGTDAKVVIGVSEAGSILAMRYQGDERVIVVDVSPDPRTHPVWFVQVHQDRFIAPDRMTRALVANDNYKGRGVAAITGDLRTVLATAQDRTLRILAHERDPEANAKVCMQRELPYIVRLLSIVPPDIAIVAEDTAGTMTLRRLVVDGTERWSVPMPFARGEEPPIDLGGGRVAIAGSGIAAIEAGQIVWSAPSTATVRATAFEDGTLAVSIGGELRIVDRDGAIRQSLRVNDGETITTPPAITHDGSVWVATDKALYVAR